MFGCMPWTHAELTLFRSRTVNPMTTSITNKSWTLPGLALALFGIPLIATGFRLALAPMSPLQTAGRDLAMLAAAGLLLLLVRHGERQPWSSIGFRRMPLGKASLWVLGGVAACVVLTLVSLFVIQLAGIPFGHEKRAVELPLWVTSLMVLRAGVVEELTHRAYSIERLEALTGNRALAVGLPLVVFAGFHYTQGIGGVLIAFVLGGLLTALYLRLRNLWVNMSVHFLVDFIPNVLLAGLLG